MPLPPIFQKRASAVKNYSIIWADWLDDDETIVASAWVVPDGITDSKGNGGEINVTPNSLDGVEYRALTVTTIWLSQGVAPQRYEVENTITTSEGRIESRSVFIQMVDNYNP